MVSSGLCVVCHDVAEDARERAFNPIAEFVGVQFDKIIDDAQSPQPAREPFIPFALLSKIKNTRRS